MELNNTITNGTKIFNDCQGYDRSSLMIPLNEDYSMVVKILSYSSYGIVTGTKVWEREPQIGSEKKVFYAIAKYNGKPGTPRYEEIAPGAYLTFHRVGDFDGQGTNGFELHEKDMSKASWVCFLPYKEGYYA